MRVKDEFVLKQPETYNLTIYCDKIYLKHNSADIEIEIKNDMINQYDYIIINGVKFKKDKSE